jgi:DNA-3-methyladenine glycosylase I
LLYWYVYMKKKEKIRCGWVGDDEKMKQYHDTVWGVPKRDDQDIFEAIVLDTNQAGLSWKIILHKRDNFAKAYANFNPQKVARFTQRDVVRLMKDPGIIRNRLKIVGTIKNAQAFLKTQKEFRTFSNYIWSFVGGKTVYNSWRNKKTIPNTSVVSDAMSADMKKRGFTFVGSTICYAFMQGIGMVNDHLVTCFCFKSEKTEK